MDDETVVGNFGSPLEAELAKVYLESHGVRCRLAGDVIVGAALPLQYALGGVTLSVRRRDQAEAAALLESYRSNVTSPKPRTESPDERVARALRAAVVAFGLCPVLLHAFSLSLLMRTRYGSLGSPGRQRYWLALSINLTVLLASAVLLGLYLA